MKIFGKKNKASISINNKEVWKEGDNKETITIGDIQLDFKNVKETIVVLCNKVEGSISTISGDIHVENNVCGGVSTQSGNVDVDGNVEENVTTMSGNVSCNSCNKINTMSGDIYYNK
ncbi:MAG: hypothetical protein J6D03_07275 [Clostridia bacterium]|nr:hypothetical protein [Clostridia bacterium]